jgi:hypothetical protein
MKKNRWHWRRIGAGLEVAYSTVPRSSRTPSHTLEGWAGYAGDRGADRLDSGDDGVPGSDR